MDTTAAVLIVDDDPGFRKTLSDLLKAKGYTAKTVAEGRAALAGLEENAPSVAVIDLRLEDMSGLDVMRAVKESSPDTECIILTGYASQESAIEAVNLGAYSYMQKPYDVDQLLVHIRRAAEKHEAKRALRRSGERYRELVEKANDIIYTHDLEGNFTSVNSAVEPIYGYTVEEALKLNIADIVDPEFLPLARQKIADKLEGSQSTGPYELLTRNKKGDPIWVEVSTRLVRKEGYPPEVQGIARDITERKRAEEALHRQEERFSILVEQSPLGVAILAQNGRYEYLNPKFVEMFGYTLEDIPTRRDWFAKAYPDEEYRHQVISTWISDLKESEHGEARPRAFRVTCKDGSEKVIHFRPVAMESGGQFLVCEDITERKRVEEFFKRLAYHDALTGLPNRALFENRLELALARARRDEEKVAVMLLDLDRFKNINDTLGHRVGDQLLRAVGDRLTTVLREVDTICRMGGDEFLILSPGVQSMEDSATVADRILQAMREPFDLDGQEVSITTSLGIAIYPDDTDDGDTLIAHTDTAMYQAKEQGRDRYQLYVEPQETEAQDIREPQEQ